ncbi:MAG: hypothetical protein IPO72_19995 [Saprospiraceae bacterium]|nr:hypothetical protein [Candidatus Vicinibacter affinis]
MDIQILILYTIHHTDSGHKQIHCVGDLTRHIMWVGTGKPGERSALTQVLPTKTSFSTLQLLVVMQVL